MDINNIDINRYHALIARYEKFREHMGDAKKEEVKVFEPLSDKQVEELMLIREVSRELNQKLKDDLKKASAQAEAEIKAAEIAAKEKSIENAETKTSE